MHKMLINDVYVSIYIYICIYIYIYNDTYISVYILDASCGMVWFALLN